MKVILENGEVAKIKNFRRGYGFLAPESKEDRKSRVIKELIDMIKDHSYNHETATCQYCGTYTDNGHAYDCVYRKAEEIEVLIEGGWL